MFTEIALDKLIPCPEAITREGGDDLEDLMTDITQRGLLQPLCVRSGSTANVYEVYAGRRRLEALKRLGIETAMCRHGIGLDDVGTRVESLAENLHRKPLSSAEKYEALRTLVRLCRGDIEEAARRSGLSKNTVKSFLRVRDNLDEGLLESFDRGELPADVAIALSKVDKEKQRGLLDDVGPVAKEITKTQRVKKPKGPWVFDEHGEPIAIPTTLHKKVLQLVRSSES